MTIVENVKTIEKNIQEACQLGGREVADVKVIAVTKSVGVTEAKAVVQAGITHLAENRVDKFLEKYEALQDEDVTWHLIGTLQRRKVKDVINQVDYFHALDSIKLAQEIDKRAQHPINCFLQVNVSGEASKHGFQPSELDEVITQLQSYGNLRLVGVMTMAPIDATESELDNLFEQTNRIRRELQDKAILNMPFTELSMGMSRDYQEAIRHGATFVRIGTAFFK